VAWPATFDVDRISTVIDYLLYPEKISLNGAHTLKVLETDRLILRRLSTDDAEFILRLLNDPSWLRFIGDRGVRTTQDARDYILKGPVEMYARLGFGLYLVELKEGGIPIGLCGLLKRDFLDDVDVGFGFLPNYCAQGYAYESACAVMAYGKGALGLKRVVAITTADNHRSARLLEKMGLRFEGVVKTPDEGKEVRLFAIEVKDRPASGDIARADV
jgi:RimJ/RimL family protein N-acetyltransferase